MTVKNISPWGNFVIDDATGLPQLPERGMFWRVTKAGSYFWQVQLRERTKFGFSKMIESRTFNRCTPLRENWILDGAAHCLNKYGDLTLIGDYPPKSLNANV